MSENDLGFDDCTPLADAIKNNSTITQLNLARNRIGFDDTLTELADAIRHNSTITQLNLSENCLGNGDCSALVEAIKHNSTITVEFVMELPSWLFPYFTGRSSQTQCNNKTVGFVSESP